MSNEYLAHYGVPGMKWGVRNAETQRKYAGGSGITRRIKNRRSKAKMARNAKLRRQALKSHDPKKVAKGMHLLSNAELDRKLKRLKTEDEVLTLAKKRTRKVSTSEIRNLIKTADAIAKYVPKA